MKISDNRFSACILYISVLVFYLWSLCSTVFWEDSGEFITSSWHLGISHPSGFPFYLILCKCCSLLPLGNIAFRVNLLSAIMSTASIFLLFYLFRSRFKEIFTPFLVSVTFLFSPIIWINSVTTEAYTVFLLFIIGILWSLESFLRRQDIRFVYLMIFLLGLTISIHVSAILMGVAIVISMFAFHPTCLRDLINYMLFFLLGVSVYFYLPIRSVQDPIYMWSRPGDLQMFTNHLFAVQYRGIMADGSLLQNFPLLVDRLKFVGIFLRDQYSTGLLVTGILGLAVLARRYRRLCVVIVLITIGDLLYCTAINFEGLKDHQAGFILCLVSSITIGIGLGELIRILGSSIRYRTIIFLTTFCILCIPFTLFLKHNDYCNKKGHDSARSWGFFLQNRLPDHATVWLKQSDSYSIWCYLALIEHRRDDISCGSRNKKQYLILPDQGTESPLQNTDHPVGQYSEKYVKGINDPDFRLLISEKFRVEKLHQNIFWELGGDQVNAYNHLVPHGLLFQITASREENYSSPGDQELIDNFIHWLEQDDTWRFDWKAGMNIKTNLYNRALYHFHRGNYLDAVRWNKFAFEYFPDDVRILNNLAASYASSGLLQEALQTCEIGIALNPKYAQIYKNAGLIWNMAGNQENARFYFSKALELDPYDSDIRKMLHKGHGSPLLDANNYK